jgi:uncharacterized membrane protein SpoIIM required for sporulation
MSKSFKIFLLIAITILVWIIYDQASISITNSLVANVVNHENAKQLAGGYRDINKISSVTTAMDMINVIVTLVILGVSCFIGYKIIRSDD